MSRYFNNQEVELLAPAGTFDIFNEVIHSGADAIYFGGKILNMRMHRKDYNFSNEEIIEAIKIAHSLNKKVYITVNNLFDQKDLKDAVEYLKFLDNARPDAIIIQDLSILELIDSLNLNLTLHASVMMNVHNKETIKLLKEKGITRIVASREMDLKTINTLHAATDMEFEYFVHGDMCVAHGSACLYSGMLFGQSSNRGLCMKPCRWNFSIKKDGFIYDTEYPLAVKDMCMYEHIPELIDAGVVSFKIEGRMRDSTYLINLINYYSDSINRYIDDPLSYDRKKESNEIYETRKRDLSTGYAFGKPGLENINRRYEGTGKFYSHGKVFSKPIDETEISKNRISIIKDTLNKNCTTSQPPTLGVKVNSYVQASIALEQCVDAIYLSCDVYEPNKPFSKKEIIDITNNKKSTKIYLALPRMMNESDFNKYSQLLMKDTLGLDGLVVTNLGALNKFKDLDLELIGDYSLNIYNHKATTFYMNEGLSLATVSVESPLTNTIETIKHSPIPIEMIVHGSPVVMYLEHDLYENITSDHHCGFENNTYVNNNILVLVDDKLNEHPVYRDSRGRNYMTLYKDLCYLPFLKELNNIGLNRFRIEGCHYKPSDLKQIIITYKKAINDLNRCDELYKSLVPTYSGFTLGSFEFN